MVHDGLTFEEAWVATEHDAPGFDEGLAARTTAGEGVEIRCSGQGRDARCDRWIAGRIGQCQSELQRRVARANHIIDLPSIEAGHRGRVAGLINNGLAIREAMVAAELNGIRCNVS